jgi:hypothetical protein
MKGIAMPPDEFITPAPGAVVAGTPIPFPAQLRKLRPRACPSCGATIDVVLRPSVPLHCWCLTCLDHAVPHDGDPVHCRCGRWWLLHGDGLRGVDDLAQVSPVLRLCATETERVAEQQRRERVASATRAQRAAAFAALVSFPLDKKLGSAITAGRERADERVLRFAYPPRKTSEALGRPSDEGARADGSPVWREWLQVSAMIAAGYVLGRLLFAMVS